MARYAAWADRHLDVRQRMGDEYVALCIFHSDSSPSMSINVRKGLFHCFACGAGGSMQALAKRVNATLTGTASLDELHSNIDSLRKPEAEIVKRYPEAWLARFDFEHEYWRKRGLSPWAVRTFSLGWDPKHDAVTIPLRDLNGNLLGVIRRMLDPNARPRYVYPKGFRISRYVFGASMVRKRKKQHVALCEGSLDAIACWDARIPALAMLGSSLSAAQADVIRSLGIRNLVIMTDNDKAGWRAAQQVKDALPGIPISHGDYRRHWQAKDPAELSKAQRREMFDTAKYVGLG